MYMYSMICLRTKAEMQSVNYILPCFDLQRKLNSEDAIVISYQDQNIEWIILCYLESKHLKKNLTPKKGKFHG